MTLQTAETPVTLGVISDTHGLLRPQAIEALQGSVRILHAGDVGAPAILEALAKTAPVTAIRGNVDTAPWARTLLKTEIIEINAVSIYMLHDLSPTRHQTGSGRIPRGCLWSQPSPKNRREERRALFQSRQRRTAAFQSTRKLGEVDDPRRNNSGGVSRVDNIIFPQ
jgi:calcineurin-like phosphoesterase family protein